MTNGYVAKEFNPQHEINHLKMRVFTLESMLKNFFSQPYFTESALGPNLDAVKWATAETEKER